MQKHPPFKNFISIFENLAYHKRRHTVFSDFVEMSALALHNGCRPFLTLERFNEVEGQFMAVRNKYSDDEYAKIRTLFHLLIDMLTIEPSDVLGQLYMQLELGNAHAGQFFTPDSVSEMMARMTYWDAFSDDSRPYVTFSDPACGAGSTLIAVVKIALEKGKNPLKNFWMHAQDIDRNVALMCYVQLSLLGVPACIAVGDSLSQEPPRETLYTLTHYLGMWGTRLNRDYKEQREECQAQRQPLALNPVKVNLSPKQLGFDFA